MSYLIPNFVSNPLTQTVTEETIFNKFRAKTFKFDKAYVKWASFEDIEIEKGSFLDTNLENTYFSGKINNCNFKGAKINGAIFYNVTGLSLNNLKDAEFKIIYIDMVTLKKSMGLDILDEMYSDSHHVFMLSRDNDKFVLKPITHFDCARMTPFPDSKLAGDSKRYLCGNVQNASCFFKTPKREVQQARSIMRGGIEIKLLPYEVTAPVSSDQAKSNRISTKLDDTHFKFH